MNDHTAANLEALFEGHPELEPILTEPAEDSPGLDISETPSGSPTARLEGIYLHSRYDPLREARRKLAGDAAPDPSAALVLGFGLGYPVQAFRQRYPDKPVVIVEASPALFLQALGARDLRALLSDPMLVWCIGEEPESVMMKMEQLPLGKLAVLRLPNRQRTGDSGYYRRVETLLTSIFDKRKVNINTLERFGELWVRNLLSNLGRFVASPGIAAAQDLFSDIPALVLAAGPSLDEVLPHLDALHQRCLLVAVDTSYRFCSERGIEPDFLVTVDPQYWNSRHLDWLSRSKSILVSESSAHPRVFRTEGARTGQVFFVSSFFPLGTFVEQIIGKRGLIGAGGSVATTAWDLSRYLGCSPIYMAGLDLGFPEKRTHAKGAFFEESMHLQATRFQGAEQMTFEYLHQAHPVALKNNVGGRTLTDRRMLIYKDWFENQIKQQTLQGGVATYSLSGQGIAVEGIRHIRTGRLLRLPRKRGRIDESLGDLRSRGEQMVKRMAGEGQADRIRRRMGSLAVELEELQKLAASGVRMSESGGPAEALVPALAEVDQKILSLASRQIAGFLFQPLIREILDNPEGGGGFDRVLATSRNLYRNLEASASYHRRLLEKCLQRL